MRIVANADRIQAYLSCRQRSHLFLSGMYNTWVTVPHVGHIAAAVQELIAYGK